MRRMLICLSLAAMIALSGCGSASNPQAEAAAVAAGEAWLLLVDGEKYAESWEAAAASFKVAVPKDEWIRAMQSGRKPLGKNISRDLKSKRYRTALPGAPDGEYVVIQYKASFGNKQYAIETLTPMLDKDGQWRVAGYYMK